MPKLRTLCDVIRSKNAGPFIITIDAEFSDKANFERVKNSGVLTPEVVAKQYKLPVEDVYGIYFVEGALAAKVSLWKPHPAGDPECTSVLGGEFHVPLADLEIP